jgi:ribose transport system ATP-binding protein
MNALFGMRQAASGRNPLDGKPTIASPARSMPSNGIAFVTENRKEEGLVLVPQRRAQHQHGGAPASPGRSAFMRAGAEERKSPPTRARCERLAIKTASIDTQAGSLSGRQPAEDRAGQMAADRGRAS